MKYAVNVLIVLVAAGGCGNLGAQIISGDAARGEQLLRDHGCSGCHQVNRQGGHTAPDLGKPSSRNYTPGSLSAVIWNHAPTVWARTDSPAQILPFSEEQVGDLFAYFYAQRFFDHLGDAARGKRLFVDKCSKCHGISTSPTADAHPAVAWRSLRDPISLAQAMWNRPQLMNGAFDRKGIRCPPLASQELTDLLIYLENLPEIRGNHPGFHLAPPETGQALYQAKGCAKCHQGSLSMEYRVAGLTPLEVAAAMWNRPWHTPKAHPTLNYDEMNGIVSYLWAMGTSGDARRGQQIFAKRGCDNCHGKDSGTPGSAKPLFASEQQSASVSMVEALWSDGSAMQKEMGLKGLSWPRLASSDITDLGAYLATRRSAAHNN